MHGSMLLFLTMSAPAAAGSPPLIVEQPGSPSGQETQASVASLHGLQPVSDIALGEQRGGEVFILTSQHLHAITSGNIFNGDYTAGAVSLSDNALSNFNGLGNIVINTGAQVSLQSGMNITINTGE